MLSCAISMDPAGPSFAWHMQYRSKAGVFSLGLSGRGPQGTSHTSSAQPLWTWVRSDATVAFSGHPIGNPMQKPQKCGGIVWKSCVYIYIYIYIYIYMGNSMCFLSNKKKLYNQHDSTSRYLTWIPCVYICKYVYCECVNMIPTAISY